jgi:hypothetical protein
MGSDLAPSCSAPAAPAWEGLQSSNRGANDIEKPSWNQSAYDHFHANLPDTKENGKATGIYFELRLDL